MKRLLYWCEERERMRERRLAGKKVLTIDPILREWRFCNVRREDDRVTRWIKSHVRERYALHSKLWMMLALARQINWPPTLEWMIERGHWPSEGERYWTKLGRQLDRRMRLGVKCFTGAYRTSIPPQGISKGDWTEKICRSLWKDKQCVGDYLGRYPSLAATHRRLKRCTGFGTFLAYQSVVDMRFTHLLRNAPDKERWAAAGPGTLRGLNRLVGRAYEARISQDTALSELRDVYEEVKHVVDLDFSDVPNIMCEYDKYERVRLGQGTPRARYVPFSGW